jgi:phosphoribosylamine--glycine ligase/phosphoribosylaminoimidazole synthetase
MNIIVIGSGARETAIIKNLLNKNVFIYVFGQNRNPYILDNCKKYIHFNDKTDLTIKLVELNKSYDFEFSFIGPEAPLEWAMADLLFDLHVPCIGPFQYYANIETSKLFCRDLIKELKEDNYNPLYFLNNDNNDNNDNIDNIDEWVIKKDGLCGGKGVIVENIDFKKNEREKILQNIKNEKYLIEEKLYGEEFSLMTLTDGYNNNIHFPPIQDFKRLNNNNKGPNTGGMGCIIDINNTLPFLNQDDIDKAKFLNEKVINHFYQQRDNVGYGIGYRGILYGSFIKTLKGEIKLIEYNSRFGDPEGVIALELLENSFLDICTNIIKGIKNNNINFSKSAIMGLYLVPITYPNSNFDKYDIYIEDNITDNIYYANVELSEDKKHIYTLKSRSILVTSKGKTLIEANTKVNNIITKIHSKFKYRNDIINNYLSKYEQSGVSINNGENAIKLIKPYVEKTNKNNVSSQYGSFGGEFLFNNDTLVASIDGVGTKSILATEWFGKEAYINLGHDIVNHSINDILVQGAFPLFFLDYYGCSNLDTEELVFFIKGISQACQKYNIVLLGGETAEMADIYKNGITDLVGCIIGNKKINLNGVKSKDIILGINSVSPHTNGYSLIRKVLKDKQVPDTLKNILCKPHKSYLEDINNFIKEFGENSINAMAHITGGGINSNISRVTNNLDFTIFIDDCSIKMPEWCNYIKENGEISLKEMYEVFNCGIGFVIIISPEIYQKIIKNNYFSNFIKIGFIN